MPQPNKPFKGFTITATALINRLKILVFLPAIIIAFGFLFFVDDAYTKLQDLNKLKENTQKIKDISTLINSLQQERGLSSGFLASQGKKFQQKLEQQRQYTNSIFSKLILHTQEQHNLYRSIQRNLKTQRMDITYLRVAPNKAFNFYTDRISRLQIDYLKLLKQVKEHDLKNRLLTYADLSFTKEALGEIRGSVNGVLSQQKKNKHFIHLAILAEGKYELSLQRLNAFVSQKYYKQLESISSLPDYRYIENILFKITNEGNDFTHVSPQEWFKRSTNVIEQFFILEQNYLHEIDLYIQKKSYQLLWTLVGDVILFFLITLFTLVLGLHLKREITQNLKLLDQYKRVVDRSSIVSKTDKSGRITYANERFCNISGYSKEELLGKHHNIVRHPDMPKAAFKEMWQTILDKKPWFGVIRNKKKDGGEYIVEVTINPILDQKGEIQEFIAIRNDITQIITLHNELQHTQEDIIFRMGEIGETRSKETGYHVRRVAKYSAILAKHYGLSEEEVIRLTQASPMHDIGKVAVPDNILNKAGKLTSEEWSVMKTHTQIGYDLFKNSDKKLLQAAATIAYEHHEKYDGSGYPKGLKGDEIHIYGRITALADVFDALGTKRVYKDAWSDEKIFKLFKEERGKHFDPKLVDIFFEHLDEFLAVRDFYNDASSYMKEH